MTSVTHRVLTTRDHGLSRSDSLSSLKDQAGGNHGLTLRTQAFLNLTHVYTAKASGRDLALL